MSAEAAAYDHPIYKGFEIRISNVHTLIRRSLEQICDLPATLPDADIVDFMGYCLAALEFLHHHHSHEDEIAFPAVLSKFPQCKTLSEEHVVIDSMMKWLVDYCTKTLATPTYFATTKSEFVTKSKTLLAKLKPHLAEEQDMCQHESIRKAFPGKEGADHLVATEQKIAAANQKASPMAVGLAFMLTGLTPEEYGVFFESVPWLVRTLIFPTAKWKHANWWRFAKLTGGLTV